jgi:hypothetical protein
LGRERRLSIRKVREKVAMGEEAGKHLASSREQQQQQQQQQARRKSVSLEKLFVFAHAATRAH